MGMRVSKYERECVCVRVGLSIDESECEPVCDWADRSIMGLNMSESWLEWV